MSSKRFILVVEISTKENNDKFLQWLRSEGMGWWHWFQNVWLLVDRKNKHDAGSIRDVLGEYFGSANTLVLELDDNYDTWAGYGPIGEEKNMFKWLKKNWHNV